MRSDHAARRAGDGALMRPAAASLALRLGLRMIAGLSEAGAQRIVTRDAQRPFARRRRPRAPRARSTAAISRRSPPPTRSRRSPAIATAPCGTSPASRRLPPLLAGTHVRRSRPGAAGADRRAGHRRRLPHARPDAAAAIRSRSCATQLRQAAAADRRRDRADAARPHRAHRRHRHRPPAARHRERRRVRHARGRDRRRQRDRVARSRATASGASCWARG